MISPHNLDPCLGLDVMKLAVLLEYASPRDNEVGRILTKKHLADTLPLAVNGKLMAQ